MKDNLRIWVLGSVLVIGVLLAGGWFVGVSPLLSSAQANDASADQADQQNQAMQTKLLGLEAAQRNIGALRVAAATADNAVPASLDAQSFVNRVNVLAAEDGVKVLSITPGMPTAYAQPDPSAGRVDVWVSPSVTAANFAVIPISVQVSGDSKQDLVFLGHLQHDSRLFLVNGYTYGANTTGAGGNAATISGYIYALKSTGSGS